MTYLDYINKKDEIDKEYHKGIKYFISILFLDFINSFIKSIFFKQYTNFSITHIFPIIGIIIMTVFHLIHKYIVLNGKQYVFFDSKVNDVVNSLIDKDINNIKRQGLALGNIYTIMQHPHLPLKRQDPSFLGWIENNNISFTCTKNTKTKYLKINPKSKRKLWVSTNCIDLDLPLVDSDKDDCLNIRVLVYDSNTLFKKQLLLPFIYKYANDNKHIKLKKDIEKRLMKKI